MSFENYESLADKVLNEPAQEASSTPELDQGHVSEKEVMGTLQSASRIIGKEEGQRAVEINAGDVIEAIGNLIGSKGKKQEAPPTPQQETVTVDGNSVLGNMIRTSRATRNPKTPENNG